MSAEEKIFGIHAVKSALTNSASECDKLLLQQGQSNPQRQILLALAEEKHIPIQYVKKSFLDKYTDNASHQGAAIALQQIDKPTTTLENFLSWSEDQTPLFLILDCIQDPHNLGACLRTAECAGVTAVIIPKNKSASITSTVRKVAAGATEYIPVIEVVNLARSMKQLQQAGVWIYGAAGQASTSVYEQSFSGAVAIVMGNEEQGLRYGTSQQCDHLINIPMYGKTESLNVSVASAIILYEVLRQRLA